MPSLRLLIHALSSALAFTLACSDDASSGGGGESGDGGSGATGNAGGNGASSADGGGTTSFESGGNGGTGQQGGGCAGEVDVADPVPLDLYIMLDASGSMTDKTGTMGQGVEKWEAITSALDSFFTSNDSNGLGIGLQFFPLTAAGAPASCSSQADCGAFGPCLLKVCQGNTAVVCSGNADCGNQGPCIDVGECANNLGSYCLPIGASCPGMQGQCVQVTSSICLNTDSCAANDYATPAVPIATLPGVYPDLGAAIAGRSPQGATPTSAALSGAIDYAATYATANPGHVVVAVLATDGLPTECDPTDADGIAQIAAQGLAGPPAIKTFVIGIISGNDQGAQNLLNDVAASGGTEQAFFVDPGSQDVEGAFLDALDAIQGSALSCEYFVPQPEPPEMIAYDAVNVLHTPEGSDVPVTIGYVGSAAACDPEDGGWYYDVDPMDGTPSKILICPATCTVFGAGGTVEIQVGCETVVAVPR